MSLHESIVSRSVYSAMASNRSLANITSTTLAKTGTSIPQIQRRAAEAARNASAATGASSSLTAPIDRMRDYALANTPPSQRGAVLDAARKASSHMEEVFAQKTSAGDSLENIQNAAGEAIASGVSNFSTRLQSFGPSIAEAATEIGNNYIPQARQAADTISESSYRAASSSLSEQIVEINNTLATDVQAQNAEAQSGDGVNPTPDETNAMFTGKGVWAGVEDPVPEGINTTDVVYQDIKLYIEGVQVPFEAISISQTMGDLPTASIQVPPQASLMDIARYYQPKVHIFFTDKNLGGDRLLFWGHIVACNYAKSRQQGMATISFRCVHKNALLNQVTLEWSDYVRNALLGGGDPNPNLAVSQPVSLNSMQSLLDALKGVTGMQTDPKDLLSPDNPDIDEADVTKIDQRWRRVEKRLIGMPAAVMNFWNQLKKTCYRNPGINTIMEKIYLPLIEEGIGFFDRLSGHYYLEKIIQDSKQPFCPEKETSPNTDETVAMVPPSFRLPSITAISTTLALQSIANQLNFSGEMATFAQLFQDFYLSVEYEMITLASPAHVPADPTVTVNPDDPLSSANIEMAAVETIVKPQMPFYFSPLCNVLLPKMYHSINIDQMEDIVPTRITAFHDNLPTDPNFMGTNYRGPNSIREAIAVGIGIANARQARETPVDVNLKNTTGPSGNIPGKYEQGRGVLHRKIMMPYWLALMIKDAKEDGEVTQEAWMDKSSPEYIDLLNLYAAWVDRYGYKIIEDDGLVLKGERDESKDVLNPYSQKSMIHPSERLLFSTVDYEFTKQVAQARSGVIDGIFNPYIIPGYPMDIINDSPNQPSFHGLCSSVTHTISSRSIGTTIGIVAATTYTEMSNYYLPHLHPWLQTTLKMLNVTWRNENLGQTEGGGTTEVTDEPPVSDTSEFGDVSQAIAVRSGLIGNPVAKATADEFYRSVLGVGAASPDEIYDFSLGQPIPIARNAGVWTLGASNPVPVMKLTDHGGYGGDANDFNTSVGNLRLVCRPIEGKRAIEDKFGIKFIDMVPQNYNATGMFYQNPLLTADLLLEPGASLFLDYEDPAEFVKSTWSERGRSDDTEE